MDATNSHLESGRWLVEETAALRLAGWVVFTDGRAVAAISAVSAGRLLGSQPPGPRPDVQMHLGGSTTFLASGFTLSLPPVDPTALVELQATDTDGRTVTFQSIRAGDLPGRGPVWGDYAAWAESHDPDPPPAIPPAGPLFSILLPVYRTPINFLRECLDSVSASHYRRWELIVVDDGSRDQPVTSFLEGAVARDARIKLFTRTDNGGIARATNEALAAATGEFIVLLDHDDRLRPHALAALAQAIAGDPTLDALYSDEDKITAGGRRVLPLIKPGFSPEFLLGVMYVGHVLCVRTAVARAAGGFDSAFDGVQDYEFFLRITEHTRRIGHVARILYHWRQSPGSSALHGNVKGDMNVKQAAAVRAHLRRRGDNRTVVALGGHRVRLLPATTPSVETVYLSPGATPLETLRAAARHSGAEVLILVDASGAPAPEASLPLLAALAARPDSGFVAPVLLSREGFVLESGWTASAGGPRPIMRGFDPAGDGNNGTLTCDREVAAVSPRVAAVRRGLVVDADGDWWGFCHHLRGRGLYHRVCAAARVTLDLSWHETPTARGVATADPFYNRHFDPARADYSLATPPPAAFRWHLDSAVAATLDDGCVDLHGWCFRSDGEACHVRVTVGSLAWSSASHLPRPDVAAAHPEATTGACGFRLRLRLPPGIHQLELAAWGGGEGITLTRASVRVPASAPLRRWLAPKPAHLVAFQLMAGPSQFPRPIRPEKFPAVRPGLRPKLSVVTPSYNQARFLEETLRSVLDQKVDCEYVVQDGGSNDGSVEIIRRYAAELASWDSSPDSGQAEALTRGFARTTGGPDDIMAWINSDDFYLPGSLAYVVDYFARHPDVDVVYGHRILVDEASLEIGRWFMPPHDDEILRLNDFIPQETLFWRRRAWERAGGMDTSFNFAMDWDLLLRFSQAGAIMMRVPHFLGCFRLHASQKTSATLHDVGQKEIEILRSRTQGRTISPAELETNPRVLRYLRRSAREEFLHQLRL